MPIGPIPAGLGQLIHASREFGNALKSLMERLNNANVCVEDLISIMPKAFDPLKDIIAPEMQIFGEKLKEVGKKAKNAGINVKGLMDEFAKGFGKGILFEGLSKLGAIGEVLKPLFGVLFQGKSKSKESDDTSKKFGFMSSFVKTMGKDSKKIKDSAESSKGMFKAMKQAGGAAAVGIIGFLDKIGVIGMILKPFEPILTMIGGLLKTFLAPVIIAVTNALQPLYKWLQGLMPIFQELGEKLAPIIAQIFSVLIEIFMEFTPLIEALLPPIMSFIGLLLENKTVMEVLLFPLKLLAFLIKLVVGWLVGHSPGLIPALETVAEIVQMLVEGALTILTEILEFLGEVMENVAELIQIVADIFLGIGELINDLILGVLDAFNAALQILGNIIKALISGAIKILTSVFNFLGKVMKNITKIIQSFIKIIQMLNKIINALIGGAIKILITIFKFLGDVMKGVGDIIKVVTNAFKWFGDFVKGLILGILGAFTDMLKVLRDIIVAILTPLNSFIGLIRDVIGIFTGGGGGGGVGGGFFGAQHGGLAIPPGGLYNIAEAGKPEHIIPDELLEDYFAGLQYALEDKLETLILLEKRRLEEVRWRAGWK